MDGAAGRMAPCAERVCAPGWVDRGLWRLGPRSISLGRSPSQGDRMNVARTALAVVVLSLAAAPAAHAAITLSSSPVSPVVGESITFSNNYSSDCEDTFTYTVDGVARPPST